MVLLTYPDLPLSLTLYPEPKARPGRKRFIRPVALTSTTGGMADGERVASPQRSLGRAKRPCSSSARPWSGRSREFRSHAAGTSGVEGQAPQGCATLHPGLPDHADHPWSFDWVGGASFMNASRSRMTHSGRSQCTDWPVSGYTLNAAPGIAAASSSSRGKKAACSPAITQPGRMTGCKHHPLKVIAHGCQLDLGNPGRAATIPGV
jgi:hypothetical protein